MGLSLSLPRAAALTEELSAPVPPLEPEVLPALRQRLCRSLSSLAAAVAPGERLVLDRWRLSLALRRPEHLTTAAERPFTMSPASCRRSVGLAAVERCLRRRAPGPGPAVASVLAEGAADAVAAAARSGGQSAPVPWWANWYAGLAPGARAVVAAEATTWATQLWTALAWEQLPGPVVVGGPDDWWDLPGRRCLTLRGRADLRLRVEGRSVLVVVGAGAPDSSSRVELLFAALVAAMAGSAPAAPGRVVGLWPAGGQVRVVPVEASSLEAVADYVPVAAGAWVRALGGQCQEVAG